MKIGDVVQNIETEIYGTVHYSSFGFSIHTQIEYEDGKFGLSKTLGHSRVELMEHWKVVDMPSGYYVHGFGGLIKEKEMWLVVVNETYYPSVYRFESEELALKCYTELVSEFMLDIEDYADMDDKCIYMTKVLNSFGKFSMDTQW